MGRRLPCYDQIVTQESGARLDPVVEAFKRDVDMASIRKNLKLTVEERFLQLIELQRFAEELRRAGAAAGK